MISKEDFAALNPRAQAGSWTALEGAMLEFGIHSKARAAMFLAQVAHESGGFYYLTEIWGPTPAQARYEGRLDLGNTQTGDGYRYRGRGFIQLTGRDNYRRIGKKLGIDLEGRPELASQVDIAARVAGYFWQSHDCNQLADAGDFMAITRTINGGYNGVTERKALLERYQRVVFEGAKMAKVFLKDLAGKNTVLDTKATTYGGVEITRLDDGRVRVGGLELTIFPDGALLFQRAPEGKKP